VDKVSVYCSAIRPHMWPRLTILESNKVDFEIIFAGNVKPKYDLPPYMKHIYTEVKPAQCYYVAGLQAQGNYMLNIADDMIMNEGFLDNMLKMLKENDESSTIISPRYQNARNQHSHVWYDILLPVGSFCSRKLWERYPFDKRFVASYWDLDVAMLNYRDGGKLLTCEGATTVDVEPYGVCNSWGDRKFFYRLWARPRWKGNKIHFRRRKAHEPLVDSSDLLVKSQGKTGKWR